MKKSLLFLVIGLLYSCANPDSIAKEAMEFIKRNRLFYQKNYSELDNFELEELDLFSESLLNEYKYNQGRELREQELDAWLDSNFQINEQLTYYKLIGCVEDSLYTYDFSSDSYYRYYGDIGDFIKNKDFFRKFSEGFPGLMDQFKEGEHFYAYRNKPKKLVYKYQYKVNLYGVYKLAELHLLKLGSNDYKVVSYKHYPYVE